MDVLIIEDERGVAQNLCDILLEIRQDIKILAIIETVKEAVSWIRNNPLPDLGFFDIRLADGESFEIFEKADIGFPVIFTTAYDEYTLRAFKVNSIDYLLKPIEKKSLHAAVDKYEHIYNKSDSIINKNLVKALQDLKTHSSNKFKRSFLVNIKDQILPLAVENIAYFYLENGVVYCTTHKKEKYVMNQSLDKISSQVNPEDFFSVNRQFLISRKSIEKATQHFNRKLKLHISPPAQHDIFVSKTNTGPFKKWLEM